MPVMTAFLRCLTVCLALLAVGVSQIFGIGAGYFCSCTGTVTATTHCQPDACHPPEDDGCHGCLPDRRSDEGGEPAGDDSHRHHEVRDPLTVAGSPPSVAAPAVVLYILPPPLQLPASDLRGEGFSVCGGPDPPGPPQLPLPVIVARTMVMLI